MKGDHERVKRFRGEIKERITEHTRHEALQKLGGYRKEGDKGEGRPVRERTIRNKVQMPQ